MRTNEKRTVLREWKDVHVKARYFWAGKDKMVPYDDQVNLPVGWVHAKARMDLLEFTETFESLDKTIDLSVAQLYVNDVFIGELFEIKEKETEHGTVLSCKIIVGYN